MTLNFALTANSLDRELRISKVEILFKDSQTNSFSAKLKKAQKRKKKSFLDQPREKFKKLKVIDQCFTLLQAIWKRLEIYCKINSFSPSKKFPEYIRSTTIQR